MEVGEYRDGVRVLIRGRVVVYVGYGVFFGFYIDFFSDEFGVWVNFLFWILI